MKKTVLPLFLIFCVLLTNWPAFAQTNFYVSDTGTDDSNCQDPNAPCNTINYAFAQTNPNTDNTTPDVINVAAGLYFITADFVIDRSIVLRGAFAGIRPTLANRTDPTAESKLIFFSSANILISNNVNYVTIEGMEFRAAATNVTEPLIGFAPSSDNSNITIRWNVYNGNSDLGGYGSFNEKRPFLIKEAAGTLSNIIITANRILGLNEDFDGFTSPAINLQTVQTGQISGNIIGSFVPGSVNSSTVYAGLTLANVAILTVAENIFENITTNAIEVANTQPGGTLTIEFNNFFGANQVDQVIEPVAAAILLRADAFANAPVIIRNNNFENTGLSDPNTGQLINSRFAIAIPASNSGFSTNSITIVENKFSETNASQGAGYQADVYVGGATAGGVIAAEGNWWGTVDAPIISSSPDNTTDILDPSAAAVRATVWLTEGTNLQAAGLPGFISGQVVTFRNVGADLPAAFTAVPEDWTLQAPDIDYSGATAPTVQRSFVLSPVAASETFPGLILNGTDADATEATLTLDKPLQIADGGALSFVQGKIALGGNDLTLTGMATVDAGSLGNANSFVITDGNGRLVQQNVSTAKNGYFPIGYSEDSFTPATITVPSGAVTLAARVETADPVLSPIIDNTNSPTSNVVGVKWQIDNLSGGNQQAQVTLQWNTSDELPDFFADANRVSYISRQEGSLWINQEWPATEAASVGAGVWQRGSPMILNPSNLIVVAGNNAPLPVDLINFEANLQNNSVLLTWNTASEKDNAYFAVERSTDSKTFAEIGKVNGRGTIADISTYTFADAQAMQSGAAVLYYRLKQVDTDGKSTYSKVASVTTDHSTVTIYPNPADWLFTITAPGQTEMQLVNAQGQIVLQKTFISNTEVDVTNLAKGIYIVKLLHKDKVTTQKVSVY